MKSIITLLFALLLIACSNENDTETGTQTSENDRVHGTSHPVYSDLDEKSFEENTIVCIRAGEGEVLAPAQVEALPEGGQRIWWIADQKADEPVVYTIVTDAECEAPLFSWEPAGDESSLLRLENQPVLQYEHPVFDSDDVEQTKKPFHHLFDPSTAGEEPITKGTGGLYPHHRGIFFGYNHVYMDGDDRQIDIWHARDGERSEHVEVLEEFTGLVMGGHTVKIHWKNHDGETFLDETRTLRVFKLSNDELLVDFHSLLRAVDGPVTLEGDRHHAGVQFRAAQYVADHPEQTRFIRPEHLSHLAPGEELEEIDELLDLPWNAMKFMIEERPFTVAYLSHPSNPDQAEMSERLYGRFGEFFSAEVTEENPLEVKYRFLVRAGTLSPEEIESHYRSYAAPSVAEIVAE